MCFAWVLDSRKVVVAQEATQLWQTELPAFYSVQLSLSALHQTEQMLIDGMVLALDGVDRKFTSAVKAPVGHVLLV